MIVHGNIEAPEWMSTPEKRAYRQGYQQATYAVTRSQSSEKDGDAPAPTLRGEEPPRPLYVFLEGLTIGVLGMIVVFSSCGGWP